jgi:hypothetical protein
MPIFAAVTNTTFSHVTQTRKHQLAIGRFANPDAPGGSHNFNRHCAPPHHGSTHPHLIASSTRTNNATPSCASSRRTSCRGAVELPLIVPVNAAKREAPQACRVHRTALLHMPQCFDATAYFFDNQKPGKARDNRQINWVKNKVRDLSEFWNRMFRSRIKHWCFSLLPEIILTTKTAVNPSRRAMALVLIQTRTEISTTNLIIDKARNKIIL